MRRGFSQQVWLRALLQSLLQPSARAFARNHLERHALASGAMGVPLSAQKL